MTKSAVKIFEDGVTGWKAEGKLDAKAGFYLADVSHDGHYFAESVRLERIAVAGFSDRGGYRSRDDIANYHVFGLGDATVVAEPTIVNLTKGTDPLGYYAPKLKVVTKYEMPNLVYETDQKMEIEQAFLFTSYNKDPSHEPGGLLQAGRLYPTFTFRLPDVTHKTKTRQYRRATAVQALFRLHFKLDNRGSGNQNGVFCDLEDLGPGGAAESSGATGGMPGSFTFLTAEKPLVYEIVGRGVNHGAMGGWDNQIYGWDNIHQWSHPVEKKFDSEEWLKKGLDQQPPTPGLPYGAHVHWRWGETAATGAPGLKGTGPHFGGPQGPGTPLIDDKIRDQNIEFAIIDLDGSGATTEKAFLKRVDTDPVTSLFRDFSDIWSDIQLEPGIVMPSGDMVIWMSITAWGPGYFMSDPDYREFSNNVTHTVSYFLPEWGGTIFPHGIFFPHEDDSYLRGTPINLIPGVRKSQYLPGTPKRSWRR